LNRQSNSGKVFSYSTIFRLPNGGDRSPDVAWIKRERWEALSAEEREKFPPFNLPAILSGEDVLPGFVLNLT